MNTDTDLSTNAKEYQQDGYTVLRGLFDPEEVEALQVECGRLWNLDGLDDDLNLRTEFRRGPDGAFIFDRLDPVLDISPALTAAARRSELLQALATLMGGPVQLLKCKLIRKEPGVAGYAAHQDFLYWKWVETAPDLLSTVVINLYPSDERSGGIGFYRGRHERLHPGPPGDPDGDFDPTQLDAGDLEFPVLDAGDVLVFHSLAPHLSRRNDSDHPRTILLPSYCVTDEITLYQRYYQREVVRRCQELVGFERFFARNGAL